MNEQNPYKAPQEMASHPLPSEISAIDWASLLAIARSQRFVCWALVVGILLTIFSLGVSKNPFWGTLSLLLIIGAGILQVVAMFFLASRTYRNPAAGIVLAVSAFFPFFGLLALAFVNQKATEKLKAAGVRVGFMGAPESEFGRMAALARGGLN